MTAQDHFDKGKLTEAEMLAEKMKYGVDYQDEYIEIKVYRNEILRTKYTIDNEDKQFQAWCIENNRAPEGEPEQEADREEGGSSWTATYETDGLEEDADLVLEYCLESIKRDFPA